MVLVFVERNLERVEDEADVGFLQTVEGDQFFLELGSKNFFGSVQGCAHADLESTSPDDSGSLEAGVLSCWFYHGHHMRGFRTSPT